MMHINLLSHGETQSKKHFAIEKKVGKYDWRIGAEGDKTVEILKSLITPGALKTLSDFGKNQLGYNAVYKEELTK